MKKMKKSVLFIMAVCMIATLGITSAQAGWFTVTVNASGVGGSSTFINCTDTAATPAFSGRWFTLNNAYAKQHLATALTTLSSGAKAQIYFAAAGTPVEYATVLSLYMDNR